MRQQIVIGSGFVAKYPNGGGVPWVPLQYLRGFRDLGCDAYWLEVVASTGDWETDQGFIDTFLGRAAELGVSQWTALAFYPNGMEHPGDRIVHGIAAPELDARCRDAILLNLAASLNEQLREPFARTILFDLDPGLFQIWAAQWNIGVGRHDVHLTIGQHLGSPDSPIPLNGVEWIRTWPAVHLPSWPAIENPGNAYTTVTQWWSGESAWIGSELFDCSKRNSFVQFIDLPRKVAVPLELAANIHPIETGEHALFTSHGWRLVAPEVETRTPQQYQRYIQESRGEFGCAKPGYVKGRTGWVSDRTVCYLASGRPCVLQDTGAAAHLPPSRAIGFFSTVDEAANLLADIEGDYRRACVEARQVAEDVFATSVLLPPILAAVGA
jgi:hypothetical protein